MKIPEVKIPVIILIIKRSVKECKYCKSADVECIPPGEFLKTLFVWMPFNNFIDYKCLRKQITLIRIFAAFPFFGIFIPDLIFNLIGPTYHIPFSHLLTGICLLLIITSSFVIQLLHSKLKTDSAKVFVSQAYSGLEPSEI
jgi:hypothetical protein